MTASTVSKKLDQKQPTPAGEPPPPPPPVPPPHTPWKCAKCSTQETPVKRSGPQGPGTLCNACGLRIRKQSKAIADAGAAAAAAAAGLPPQRRPRHKKMPPPKRLTQKRKSKQHPSSPKTKRTERHHVDNTHPKPIPLPTVSMQLPTTRTVVALPNHPPRPANPVSSAVASGIVVAVTPPAQPPIVSPTPLPASTTRPHLSDPVTAPPIHVQTTRASPAAPMCVPPPTSQPTPTPPKSVEPSIASGPIKPFGSSGSLSPPLPPQPPTTPEGVNLLPVEVPADAMVAQFPQCGQSENRAGEDIIAALHMRGVTMDVGSAESTNEAEHDDFPGSVFARSDSNGTASTQVDMLGFFGGADNEESFGGVPVGTDANGVAGGHAETDSVVTQVAACVPGTVVDAHNGLAGRCVDTLTVLEHMSAQIHENVGTIDDKIAVYAQRRDELTVARNEISASISHLMSAKDMARKKQREVSENIARTTCLLNVLRKQMEFVAST